jgi:hypothetical protein
VPALTALQLYYNGVLSTDTRESVSLTRLYKRMQSRVFWIPPNELILGGEESAGCQVAGRIHSEPYGSIHRYAISGAFCGCAGARDHFRGVA